MSRDTEDGPEKGPEKDDLEFSIARSNALIPLLLLFGLSVLGIVLIIVRAKPIESSEGAPARQAFGPADFPGIFQQPPLEPLAAPSGDAGGHANVLFPVPAPPFSEGIFPCSTCHADITPNPERRELAMHDEIVLHHDEEHRWCLDCHDQNDRDHLRLASGVLIPFTESYRLCGQCHGTQYRDWREGIHGKRTGHWDGAKRYLLCVHCHNPHSPRFAALQPLPPPVRPQFLHPGDTAGGTDAPRKKDDDGGHGH
jgi:hypothetical protein